MASFLRGIVIMAEPSISVPEAPPLVPPEYMPDYSKIVSEDDTPVDNVYSAKNQRLLMDSLHSSWAGPGDGRPFIACSNVGVFYGVRVPPIVPDAFVSLDVQLPADLFQKEHRSYFIWEYGKPPDVVVEIVSNKEGEELGSKLQIYARLGVGYYIVWDPDKLLSEDKLRVYVLIGRKYESQSQAWLSTVNLGIVDWTGTYENVDTEWLRWCDADGEVIPTGAERAARERERADQEKERADLEQKSAEQAQRRAEQEKQRADQEKQRADQEKQRADQEKHRAESAAGRADKLAALLRAQGIELPPE